MIRIDENTDIDDTLVTCAEYQLFIDDMREQGKYCQPDHWSSYQFPSGQARSPIVGVRFNDAKVFCEWLTQREAGEWSYRIPTSAEVEQYPLANYIQSPLGYWFEDEDSKAQFAWVGSTPVNPRDIDRTCAHDIARLLARNFDRDRNFAHTLALNLAIDRHFDFNLARDIDRAHDRALNLAFDRARAINLVSDFDFARDLARAIIIASDHAIDRDMFLDFITLQERIAGRSPAFEGIRIVKERKP